MPTPEEIEAEKKKADEKSPAPENPAQTTENPLMAILRQIITSLGFGNLFSAAVPAATDAQTPEAPTQSGLKRAGVEGQSPAAAPEKEQSKPETPAAPLKQTSIKQVEPLKVHTYKGDSEALREYNAYNAEMERHGKMSDIVNAQIQDIKDTQDPYKDGTYNRAVNAIGRGGPVDERGHDSVAQMMYQRNQENARQIAGLQSAAIPGAPSPLPAETVNQAKYALASRDVQYPEWTADKIFKQGENGIRIDVPSREVKDKFGNIAKDENGRPVRENLGRVDVVHLTGDRYVVRVIPLNVNAAAANSEKGHFVTAEAEMSGEQLRQQGLINTEATKGTTLPVNYVEQDKKTAESKLELGVTSAGAGVYNRGVDANVNGVHQRDFKAIEDERHKEIVERNRRQAEANKVLAAQRRAQMLAQNERQQARRVERTSHGHPQYGSSNDGFNTGSYRTNNRSLHPNLNGTNVASYSSPRSTPGSNYGVVGTYR